MIIFDADTHTYTTLSGRVIPSVTRVVSALLGTSFDHIPAYILRDKAQFGTNVHAAIELYNTTGIARDDLTIHETHCLNEWIRLSKGIKPIKSEVMVYYMTMVAGTFDLVADVDGVTTMIDYKTSYELDIEYVTWQLNIYAMAYEWVYKDKIEALKAAWLPKGKRGELIDIDLMDRAAVVLGLRAGLEVLNEEANEG